MADIIQAKAPSGTNTTKRGWDDTEMEKQDVDAKEPDQLKFPLPNVRAPQVGGFTFVSGAEEFGIARSDFKMSLVLSPPDQADAVVNTTDEDLLRHERRARWRVAQCAPPFGLAQIDQQYIRFRSKLIATLLDEPIEDGVAHPGEGLIDEALRAGSSNCQDWLSRVLVEHYPTRPSLCASIVRCIGRLDYDRLRGWGMRVIDDALRNRDVEVREAAIRALEAWGGPVAIEMLRRHKDGEAWLNEYVQQVIVDLSGTTS